MIQTKDNLYAIVILLALAFLMLPVSAAPKSELWDIWQPSDEKSEQVVAHQIWDDFLKANISSKYGINLVDYKNVSTKDQDLLTSYIDQLASTNANLLNKSEQLAFWINLYNALTVNLILANYPTESIKDISSGFFPTGPWDDEAVTINEQKLTLNDIEHRILRPIWKDPRIHYAVNCASIGCPNLASDAFTADNTEKLLNDSAKDYINHPRAVNVADGKLTVSSIYIWFSVDFGGSDANVIEHLQQYANNELSAKLASIDIISDDSYDWSLNETK